MAETPRPLKSREAARRCGSSIRAGASTKDPRSSVVFSRSMTTQVEEPMATNRTISFGPFTLYPRQRILLGAGEPVSIGSRAIDLLIALLERPGELLSKDELMSRVWPSTYVVEGNLKFQIAALRRALRDGQDCRRYIATSPGQGYRFVADVKTESATALPHPPSAPPQKKHNLPARLTTLIGRDDVIAKLEKRIRENRLITIVGSGGVGKSSVAIAAAERLVEAYPDGVWCVDFSQMADPALVISAVASAVNVNLSPDDSRASLITALAGANMLLVLDKCSHVIESVASIVAALTKRARGVHILATSREPLQVEGEHLCRLEPLECPHAPEHLDAAEALQFASVELFVDRMAMSHEDFELRDEDAPIIAEICRKLDGIPLAIELAAARVDLGLHDLSVKLEEGLQVLKSDRRMVLPHHRTMQATLDWSYGLLSPAEQTVFARLAIFSGGFTLPAAAAVISDGVIAGDETVDLVLDLVTKSLVAADGYPLGSRFRLLTTTHAFALVKATERGEIATLAGRHARYFLTLFDSAFRVGLVTPETAQPDDSGHSSSNNGLDVEIDDALVLDTVNLIAALEWAFGPSGDPTVGIDLVAASLPLWISRSRLSEWHVWAERAVDSLDVSSLRGTRQEMIIRATQGISFQLVKTRASKACGALNRALELAETLSDPDYQLRILHALWIYHMREGRIRAAIALGHRAEPIAASLDDPVASAAAKSMLGISLHWAGEHEAARQILESLLQELTSSQRHSFVQRFGWDLYIAALLLLAHIHWIQGNPARARDLLDESLEEARRLQNPHSLCSALAFGRCSLALQMEDLDMAEQSAAELVSTAERHRLKDFHEWGKAAQEIIALRSRAAVSGPKQFRLAIQRWRASGWHIFLSSIDLAAAFVGAGVGDEIAAIIDEELERADCDGEHLIVPELLRLKGDLLLINDRPDPELARNCFLRSIQRAQAQGALSWELRTAISLARLDQSQGRTREARKLLQDVCDRFTEGFETSDLMRAKRLQQDLLAAH